jgi:hypothetical protein
MSDTPETDFTENSPRGAANLILVFLCRRIERQRNELREQRDKLHEALEMVRDADEDCHKDGFPTIPKTARHRIDMALAAVKGGEP